MNPYLIQLSGLYLHWGFYHVVWSIFCLPDACPAYGNVQYNMEAENVYVCIKEHSVCIARSTMQKNGPLFEWTCNVASKWHTCGFLSSSLVPSSYNLRLQMYINKAVWEKKYVTNKQCTNEVQSSELEFYTIRIHI